MFATVPQCTRFAVTTFFFFLRTQRYRRPRQTNHDSIRPMPQLQGSNRRAASCSAGNDYTGTEAVRICTDPQEACRNMRELKTQYQTHNQVSLNHIRRNASRNTVAHEQAISWRRTNQQRPYSTPGLLQRHSYRFQDQPNTLQHMVLECSHASRL